MATTSEWGQNENRLRYFSQALQRQIKWGKFMWIIDRFLKSKKPGEELPDLSDQEKSLYMEFLKTLSALGVLELRIKPFKLSLNAPNQNPKSLTGFYVYQFSNRFFQFKVSFNHPNGTVACDSAPKVLYESYKKGFALGNNTCKTNMQTIFNENVDALDFSETAPKPNWTPAQNDEFNKKGFAVMSLAVWTADKINGSDRIDFPCEIFYMPEFLALVAKFQISKNAPNEENQKNVVDFKNDSLKYRVELLRVIDPAIILNTGEIDHSYCDSKYPYPEHIVSTEPAPVPKKETKTTKAKPTKEPIFSLDSNSTDSETTPKPKRKTKTEEPVETPKEKKETKKKQKVTSTENEPTKSEKQPNLTEATKKTTKKATSKSEGSSTYTLTISIPGRDEITLDAVGQVLIESMKGLFGVTNTEDLRVFLGVIDRVRPMIDPNCKPLAAVINPLINDADLAAKSSELFARMVGLSENDALLLLAVIQHLKTEINKSAHS